MTEGHIWVTSVQNNYCSFLVLLQKLNDYKEMLTQSCDHNGGTTCLEIWNTVNTTFSQSDKINYQVPKKIMSIGASMSEPHTDVDNEGGICMYIFNIYIYMIYMYLYVVP